MFKGIDLFSDTMTRPTEPMRQAMASAEVGDEQEAEDPTTAKLETEIADRLGFGAAMFFPSATMANQVAIQLHLPDRGDEILAAENAHIFTSEAGGPAAHAGAMARPLRSTGIFDGAAVRAAVRWGYSAHSPRTRLVSVENTANMGGGIAWPMETLRDVVETARELQLKLHMDGSRLFNAAQASRVSPRELVTGFDTVTICLSKGLGCPVGALLAYDAAHFEKVRRLKQRMGGALRQSGILAAAGLYALEHHLDRLAEDHAHARELAERLSEIPQLRVENPKPSTNMVFFHWLPTQLSCTQFLEKCGQRGVRFSNVDPNRLRAVTHLDIKAGDIEKVARVVSEICSSI